MKRALVPAILATILSMPLHADAPCGMSEAAFFGDFAPRLDGFWQVHNQAGTLTMMGNTIALPPGQESVAGITVTGTEMTLSSDPMGGSHALSYHGRRGWNFDLPEDSPLDPNAVLDGAEIGVLAGCEVTNLPHLHASGSFMDPEGRVEFDLYLVVISDDAMYGVTVGRLQGAMPGIARRAISFTR